jgi:hypothetical protein
MPRCVISPIFEWCAGKHVVVTNKTVITKEKNHVTSAAKLTRLEEAVPGGLTDIGTVKPRPYHPPGLGLQPSQGQTL